MKISKKILSAIILTMVSVSVYSQGFMRTVDGKNYWTETKISDFKILEDLSVSDGRRVFRIQKSDILLVEFMEDGLVILQPDKVKKVPPVAFEDDFNSLMAKGKKVYVPLASSIVAQRSGAKRLREMLEELNFWEVVGCEEEADFILEYVYDDKGSDHAYLLFSDREGNGILISHAVSASDWIPSHAGQESAEKLFKRLIKNKIKNGHFTIKTKRVKNPNETPRNCKYILL